ncbi:MAG: hypothetical protein GX682_03235 [Clostridiaceae bacterium]|nr:hypothetical protein [Clostridiaceae bacterium]
MKKIVKIMIILLILIIILTIVMICILKEPKNNILIKNTVGSGDAGEQLNSNIHDVTEKTEYYTVKNYIGSYLKALNKNSTTYYNRDKYDETIQQEYVYNILSESYIKSANITMKNVLAKVSLYSENLKFLPIKIKSIEEENLNTYIAYGIIVNLQNKYISDLYIVVNLDLKNKTFAVEPLNKTYNHIDDIDIKNPNKSIEKNDYNEYIVQKVTNQYVTNEYVSLYKILSLSKPEIIYGFMQEDYRNKRFGSLNKFKQYVEENKNEITQIKLDEYLVNNYDDYIEYVAKDQYENLYIFKESAVANYTFTLDTYTLPQEKFDKEYAKASNLNKVAMNIDKFFQMINAKDYESAYSVLVNNFKQTNFKNVEVFKQYMKSKLYTYNDVNFVKFSDDISGVFTYYIEISNRENNKDKKIKMNVVMQLLEENTYQLSFQIVD